MGKKELYLCYRALYILPSKLHLNLILFSLLFLFFFCFQMQPFLFLVLFEFWKREKNQNRQRQKFGEWALIFFVAETKKKDARLFVSIANLRIKIRKNKIINVLGNCGLWVFEICQCEFLNVFEVLCAYCWKNETEHCFAFEYTTIQ